ncbi:two-component system, NarL family, capsular synthesis sensor histidine kinase RcsC [Paraburkholderia lycopersici]|uniref:Virulence sensor protein BvgS n=2 Tax=Paraburkholderia lycopersici TaxID=416944 RepID=A0A1G6RCN6_9BURK|nr:two-component system, NarL family, capsular synthesis sensor histidine kinase RcsC [Paraburkholderia lycopersici]
MGAAVLTLFIVLAFVLSLVGYVREDLNDERQTFRRDWGRVTDMVSASETRVRIVAAGVETVSKGAGKGDAADARTFEAQGGQLVLPAGADSGGAWVLRLAPREESGNGEAIGRFLAVARGIAGSGNNLVKTMNDAVGLPWGLSGYLVTPAASMVAISPLPAPSALRARGGAAEMARLSDYYETGLTDLGSWTAARQRGDRRLRWLRPQIDPLTGKSLFRILALVIADGRPFGVVGGVFSPARLIDRLEPGTFSGAYRVLDERFGPVTGSASSPLDPAEKAFLMAHCARPAAAVQGGVTDLFHSGNLLICAPLGDTGWTLAYVLPGRVMAARVARDVAGVAFATGLAVVLLWTFVLLFNRKILAPLFDRSERVFESEHLSRTLIETVPVGLALVNASSRAVLLESAHMQALEKRVAPTGDALIGDVLRQRAPAAFEVSRDRVATTSDVELHLRTGDGTTIDIAAKLTPSWYQGQPVVVAALSDVTAERQLARELSAAKRAADSANAAKSAFLATMSHEIRTPLNAILGHLELLERLPQAAPVAARVRTVASSSRALLQVLNDILDFSKVEAGEMSFESLCFDAAGLVREAVAMFMPLAQRKGLAITCAIDPALPPRYVGDPGRVRQIVANLLGNAIKFTDRGSVSIDVRAGEGGATPPLVIRVTDTGIGIPADRLTRVFDAFDQTDASIARRFGGTGLGLALCRRIAGAMGGTIDVSSEVGQGSVFTVTLPLPHNDDAAAVQEAASQSADDGTDMRGIRVLVAEDDEVNRGLIRDQFDALGYTSDIVENGLAALRSFNERHYDLVLTDLGMPVMDGYAFARCLRSQGARTPIIAITADVTAADTQRFRDAGISGVLLKPMSLASIDATVRRHLRLAADPKAAAAIEAEAGRAAPVLPDRLRAILEQQTAKSLDVLTSAMAQGDWETIASQVHSIKGGFAMLHVEDVVGACVRLETLLGDDPDDADGELLQALAGLRECVAHALGQMAHGEKIGQDNVRD